MPQSGQLQARLRLDSSVGPSLEPIKAISTRPPKWPLTQIPSARQSAPYSKRMTSGKASLVNCSKRWTYWFRRKCRNKTTGRRIHRSSVKYCGALLRRCAERGLATSDRRVANLESSDCLERRKNLLGKTTMILMPIPGTSMLCEPRATMKKKAFFNIGKKPTTSTTSTADRRKTEFPAVRTSTAKRPTSTASTAIHLAKPPISSIPTIFFPTCTFDQKSSIRHSATETRLGYMPLDQMLEEFRKV